MGDEVIALSALNAGEKPSNWRGGLADPGGHSASFGRRKSTIESLRGL